MSLYNDFSKLEKENSSFYYNNIKDIKPISRPSKAWNFIEKYFKTGVKESVLADDNIEKLKENGKHLHTVSMYFMGILIRELFEKKITNKLGMLIHNHAEKYIYDYTYTWFITCLFHDFSWIHENDKINNNYTNSDSCFNINLIEPCKIKHNIFKHKLVNGNDFEIYYNSKIIKNYFYYRCEMCTKLDHGIIAGIVLFDRLVKNYYDKWEEFKRSHPKHIETSDYFIHRDVSWRKEHLDHFAYIADCIISHNIWLGTDASTYKKYNLEEILQDKAKKISINNNPLLFALGFLDTIEPIKFFSRKKAVDIWKSISMEYKNNIVSITVLESAKFEYFKWFDKINSLGDWLDVSILYKNDRKIEITVNVDN